MPYRVARLGEKSQIGLHLKHNCDLKSAMGLPPILLFGQFFTQSPLLLNFNVEFSNKLANISKLLTWIGRQIGLLLPQKNFGRHIFKNFWQHFTILLIESDEIYPRWGVYFFALELHRILWFSLGMNNACGKRVNKARHRKRPHIRVHSRYQGRCQSHAVCPHMVEV